jgi:hypothetical protein
VADLRTHIACRGDCISRGGPWRFEGDLKTALIPEVESELKKIGGFLVLLTVIGFSTITLLWLKRMPGGGRLKGMVS